MILMGMVKHFQSSQNNQFAMSLQQHLKKEVRDEVDFLYADKHQSFLEIYFNILGVKSCYTVILSLLMGMIKHSQSALSNKFAISSKYLKKEVREVRFFHADEYQSDQHAQSTQNRKLI